MVYKRPWWGRQGVFGHSDRTLEQEVRAAAKEHLRTTAERRIADVDVKAQSVAEVSRALAGDLVTCRVAILVGDASNNPVSDDTLRESSVPYLSCLRFTASGLEKHRQWQHTWTLQRREDAGETVGEIPVPPKYDQDDYRDAVYWRLRGKLDVPKERFISYPGCEPDEDKSPVYGWAGWNHLQQAQALAALYVKRKTEEAWGKERLVPMLAGLDELIPWIKQWHNEPSAEYAGMRLGDYFADFVAGECQVLAVTLDDLRAWRPAEKVRGGGKKKKAKPVADELGDGEALSPRGGLRGGRMGAAPWPSPTHA